VAAVEASGGRAFYLPHELIDFCGFACTDDQDAAFKDEGLADLEEIHRIARGGA
jgi:hypothetical protein